MRAVALITLCLVFTTVTASAQDWTRKMFPVTSHDFGTVAVNAKTEFRFPIKNVFVEDVQITGIRTSCQCTSPYLVLQGESKPQNELTIKTYETAEVLAVFNTHKMTGNRRATLTLTISKPYPAEVQLTVMGNIVTDITVTPSSIDLSTVGQGTAVERTISVSRTGRRDWKIMDIRCANTNFEVEVFEKARTLSSVSYDLKVKLKDSAPAGIINDQLVLVTNDERMPQLPVQVQGEVRPELSITPNLWMAGSLNPGEEVKKTLVIRNNGKKPFKITNIVSEDRNINFKALDPDAAPKALYVLPITLVAPQEPGRQLKTLRIETDLGTTMTPELTVQYLVKTPKTNLTGDQGLRKTEINVSKPTSDAQTPRIRPIGESTSSILIRETGLSTTKVDPTPAETANQIVVDQTPKVDVAAPSFSTQQPIPQQRRTFFRPR